MVSDDGINSNPRSITSGAIEGGLIGPLICAIYNNYVLSATTQRVSFMFADDIEIALPPKPNEFSTAVWEIYADLSALDG